MMMKYGVLGCRGNDVRILEVCDTKEGVFIAKQQQREKYKDRPEIRVEAIYGDFDERGNLTQERYRILYQ